MSLKNGETADPTEMAPEEWITVEVPENWKTCELKNRPWALTVKDYPYHFWDEYLQAWMRAADSQGAIKWDHRTNSLNIFRVHRGPRADNALIKKILEALKNGMPTIIIEFVCEDGTIIHSPKCSNSK